MLWGTVLFPCKASIEAHPYGTGKDEKDAWSTN
jgi:hypothetical protein